MCGRYSLTTPTEGLRALFGFDELPNLPPRYNIAPTQDVAAVRSSPDNGKRSFTLFRWGLIPSWAKDPSIGSKMINARAETVAEKPAYRAAFRRRRCLIPADGFYEWEKREDGGKQPWRITLKEGGPFAFAGLWEDWLGADGSEVETCTIVTTNAAPVIKRIHHRMPVILDPSDFDVWLSGEPEVAYELLRPFAGELDAYCVSTRVNNVRNDDRSLIDGEAAPEPSAKAQLDLF
ncbi:MAG: SOS response-associated peptidase [Pseudomonadota bacterium]